MSEEQKHKQQHINVTDTQKHIAQLKTLNSIEHAWNSEELKLQSAHGTEKHETDVFRNTFSFSKKTTKLNTKSRHIRISGTAISKQNKTYELERGTRKLSTDTLQSDYQSQTHQTDAFRKTFPSYNKTPQTKTNSINQNGAPGNCAPTARCPTYQRYDRPTTTPPIPMVHVRREL